MSSYSRRALLKQGLAFAAGAAVLGRASRARAADRWGAWPASAQAGRLPEAKRSKKVFEFFMFGGISPWESFYVVDDPKYGRAKQEQWFTFLEGPNSVPDVFYRCVPKSTPLLVPWRKDELGVTVNLGPFAEPLRRRPDLLARTRMLVMRHDQVPHETAIPLTLTGHRLGSPKMAGVGAAVQRHVIGHASRLPDEPVSYVVRPQARPLSLHFTQAAATGLHPAYARPLTLHGAGGLELVRALHRESVGNRASSDALLAYYSRSLAERFRFGRDGPALRAPTADDFLFSSESLRGADRLLPVLRPELFHVRDVVECDRPPRPSEPEVLVRLGTHLLQRPGSEVRHVTVVDAGYIFDDFGYDTHLNHVVATAPNMLHGLGRLVDSINRPGENDPAKLDLDETMVVVNTEFGRTPEAQSVTGRNHHPNAYVILLIGGTIGPEQSGIVGAIDERGRAHSPINPVESRAAVLSAMDIFPFLPEAYAVGDVNAESDAAAAVRVKERVLGVVS